MLDHFTTSARELLNFARREALTFNHECIGPEHILAAMARNGRKIAATLLKQRKLDWPAVRNEMEKRLKKGPELEFVGDAVLTRGTKRVLRLARAEVQEGGGEIAGTEHLLLAILRDNDNIAAEVLLSHGITHESLLADLQILAQHLTSPETRAAAAAEAAKRDQLANMFLSAMTESNAMGYMLPQAGHVMMALLAAHDPAVDKSLAALNVDATRLREELMKNLQPPP